MIKNKRLYIITTKTDKPLYIKEKMDFENRLKSVALTNPNDSRCSYINCFKE